MKGRNNKKYNLNILEIFILGKQNQTTAPACPASPHLNHFSKRGSGGPDHAFFS